MTGEAIKMTPSQFADLVNPELERVVGEKLGALMEEKFKEFNAIPTGRKAIGPDDYPGGKRQLDNGGYGSLGEFLMSTTKAARGNVDERLKVAFGMDVRGVEQKASTAGHMSEGVGSEGGFSVFEEHYDLIMAAGLEQSILRNNGATIIPMRSATGTFPRVVDTSHASSVYGGVICYWRGEGVAPTATREAFGMGKLEAKSLMGLTYASNELLADSAYPLETLITNMFGGAIGFFQAKANISGSGVGEPLGIKNCGCLVTVDAESGQGSDILRPENLAKMYSRMLPGGAQRGIWIANPDVLPHLITLATGGAIGQRVVWIAQDQGFTKSPPTVILGRPVFFSEHCETAGTTGDIYFVDPMQYVIGDRQELAIASSPHVAFTTGEMAWRFEIREDGQPWLASALTPAKGSNTRSPFIALATRSE